MMTNTALHSDPSFSSPPPAWNLQVEKRQNEKGKSFFGGGEQDSLWD